MKRKLDLIFFFISEFNESCPKACKPFHLNFGQFMTAENKRKLMSDSCLTELHVHSTIF